MSNVIRYDSLLVHYLAQELDGRVGGAGLEALEFDLERREAVLALEGGDAILWRLHPMDGVVVPGPAPSLPTPVPLPRRATIRRVSTAPDERYLWFELGTPNPRPDRAARVVVELMGNQWNVLALDPSGRIIAALWPRSAGGRRLFPGAAYAAPPASTRRGATSPVSPEAWREFLAGVAPEDRTRVLVDNVAYTSPINAAAILGDAARDDGSDALDAAYERYAALASLPDPAPCLLRTERGDQPYPLPLPRVESDPFPSLLAAMEALSGAERPAAAPAVGRELLDRLRDHIRRAERRRRRLEEELAGAATEASSLRRQADLLLSQLHLVRKGMTKAQVPDFEGGVLEIELDPALTPYENAQRIYEAARKRERAAERLPTLIEEAAAERARLEELLARAEAGEATAEEVLAVVGPKIVVPGGEGKGAKAVALPYRRYRTSGGLEVRVGRGREANDELTFHHSSPNDIWLHARDVAGAHVILRWNDPVANPPARDLAEAAVLAALQSKARTSGTVAVDWTRRKYVRKPRKAPPGLVVPERTKTLFVEPDPAVEERMRV